MWRKYLLFFSQTKFSRMRPFTFLYLLLLYAFELLSIFNFSRFWLSNVKLTSLERVAKKEGERKKEKERVQKGPKCRKMPRDDNFFIQFGMKLHVALPIITHSSQCSEIYLVKTELFGNFDVDDECFS